MVKDWKQLLAAASVLLLVGAGCGARTDAGAEIDAAVEGIKEDQGPEQVELKDEEGDAAQVEADKAELNAYGDATYEVK